MAKIYVKRNPVHPYRYSDPNDLPFIQWKLVSKGTAFNMIHSKQIGWERAKKNEYKEWYMQMQKFKEEL
jgi:hypothetical protein